MPVGRVLLAVEPVLLDPGNVAEPDGEEPEPVADGGLLVVPGTLEPVVVELEPEPAILSRT